MKYLLGVLITAVIIQAAFLGLLAGGGKPVLQGQISGTLIVQ